MVFIKNIKIFFKYCFSAKWSFKPPAKKRYLIFDGHYNPFHHYINKKSMAILYRRGEEINFTIFLKCILKLKFKTIDYCKEYINQVSPKLILTAFDYYTIFYRLSKITGVKTLMLQKGKRGRSEGIIKNTKFYFPKNLKNEFHVDHMFLYNESVKKFYSNKIGGKVHLIGSFENNLKKLNFKLQKKEIVFISNYSSDEHDKNKKENEDIIAFELFKLSKKNKIKFNILPRYRKNNFYLEKEINFYKNKIKDQINFILNKNESSYNLISNYKYVFSTYSTLAVEFFSKGGRTGFLMFKSKKNPVTKYRFGDFENLKLIGNFWTSFYKLNIKEITRVFNFVVKSKKKNWLQQVKFYQRKIMCFDYKNRTFLKILNEIT